MPRTVDINWGDGSPVESWTGDKGSLDHKYANNGNYQITATPKDGGVPRTVGVVIPCGTYLSGPRTLDANQCVRPLVTGVQVNGTSITVSIAHPEGKRDTVAVIYKDGQPVAQSAPLGSGGAGTTKPIGPLAPGTYVAKACESETTKGVPTGCCEAGEGKAFTIAAPRR